jgi:hypothetical protein
VMRKSSEQKAAVKRPKADGRRQKSEVRRQAPKARHVKAWANGLGPRAMNARSAEGAA